MTKKQKKIFIRIIISAVVFVIDLIIERSGLLEKTGLQGIALSTVTAVLYLIPYICIGYDILKKAFKGIIKGSVFDENFLMAVASLGAFALGEFSEAVAVMIFYQIGELFQSVAVGKSRKNIAALMDIRPDYANLETDGGELEKVDPDEVEIGSIIVVKPGEKIPIDGVVVSGAGSLNTSALTGESVPRDVSEGDDVISGCVSVTGLLKIRTTKPFGESTVSKILDLVENSGMKKAKSEAFITKFAKVYTPAVCYSALALAVLPPIALMIMGKDANWSEWVIRALTFLVISCPCALVISVPMTFFGGIGAASSKGILIKGSNYLEAMASTKIAVFDKTGTLTKGVFEVTDICPVLGVSEEELIRLAAYGETFSDHPISLSLKAKYGKPIDNGKVTGVENIPGKGLEAVVFGEKILLGNAALMIERGVDFKTCKEPGTVVYVAGGNRFMGYILIRDVIKDGAKKALADLKKAGVRSNIMLTGDNEQTAKAVAEKLGLDGYKAELLPGDKVDEVERLLAGKGDKNILAFVGDGINDAPVLARADLGVAMGALGSDAAIEAADIVLMDDDPGKLALGMKISSKCLRICYENIVFAIGIKLLCLILGALGIANMWIAIFADVGVMILAVLNAMRCLAIRES